MSARGIGGGPPRGTGGRPPKGTDEVRFVAEALPEELARDWARDWPSWFGPGRAGVPRAPEKDWLARVETPLGWIVAKRERARGWKQPLLALGARPAHAERAFHLARDLSARGLATPEALAVLGRPGKGVLVTRYVDGVGPWELFARLSSPERLLALLADALARLHGAGFRHRDLKASNLHLCGVPAAPELVWTDLDGLRFLGTVEPRHRMRDLARLCTSFASAEARAAGVRADHWPALVRLYLERALGRPPAAEESERFLHRTRVESERHIRRHLALDRPVH